MNADDSPAANSADGAPQAAAKAAKATKRDQPYFDPVAYGNGPDDSIAATEADENAATTHHTVTVGGSKIAYTATVGQLEARRQDVLRRVHEGRREGGEPAAYVLL
jgi:carboxypeptidase C (cathepsin A)